jgi:hypothetical protein
MDSRLTRVHIARIKQLRELVRANHNPTAERQLKDAISKLAIAFRAPRRSY